MHLSIRTNCTLTAHDCFIYRPDGHPARDAGTKKTAQQYSSSQLKVGMTIRKGVIKRSIRTNCVRTAHPVLFIVRMVITHVMRELKKSTAV